MAIRALLAFGAGSLIEELALLLPIALGYHFEFACLLMFSPLLQIGCTLSIRLALLEYILRLSLT